MLFLTFLDHVQHIAELRNVNYKTCCFFPSIDFTNDVAFLVSQVSFTLHVADVTTPTFPVVTWTSPKIQGLLPFTLNLEFISFSKMVLDRVVQKSHETSLPFENFALKPCPRSYWVCSRFRYIYIYIIYITSIHIIHTCIVNTNATPSSTIFSKPFQMFPCRSLTLTLILRRVNQNQMTNQSTDLQIARRSWLIRDFLLGNETWTEGGKELK